jgi:hypothetical protein
MSLRLAFDLDGVLADMNAALEREAEQLFGGQPCADGGNDVTPDRRSGWLDRRSVMKRRILRRNRRSETLDRRVGHSSLRRSWPVNCTTPVGPEPAVVNRGLSSVQLQQLWHAVRGTHNFWEHLAELVPGTVARLGHMARARRWEVLFLTQRPATRGDTAQLQSQRWLHRHGFEYPSVFVTAGSRSAVAKSLNLHVAIDDRLENCVDILADSDAYPILVSNQAKSTLVARAQRVGIGVVVSANACLDILNTIGSPCDRAALRDSLNEQLAMPRRRQRDVISLDSVDARWANEAASSEASSPLWR